jgi:mono/diheme cytochrome c family protein
MRRGLALILFLALGCGAGLAAGIAAEDPHFERVPAKDHARANPFNGKAEAVSAGGTLYKNHCSECHQADANGDGKKKPSLRTPEVKSATDGDLEWFLRQGDLRHGMPSWSSLTQAQRWAVIAYLRSLQ